RRPPAGRALLDRSGLQGLRGRAALDAAQDPAAPQDGTRRRGQHARARLLAERAGLEAPLPGGQPDPARQGDDDALALEVEHDRRVVAYRAIAMPPVVAEAPQPLPERAVDEGLVDPEPVAPVWGVPGVGARGPTQMAKRIGPSRLV